MSELEKAPCEFPCADNWRVAQVRESAMRAYLDLERREQIAIQYPVRLYKKSGRVEIRYLAALPHEWTLEELQRVEKQIRATGETVQTGMDLAGIGRPA